MKQVCFIKIFVLQASEQILNLCSKSTNQNEIAKMLIFNNRAWALRFLQSKITIFFDQLTWCQWLNRIQIHLNSFIVSDQIKFRGFLFDKRIFIILRGWNWIVANFDLRYLRVLWLINLWSKMSCCFRCLF